MSYKTKACQICGKEYQPTNGRQKYCTECAPAAAAKKQKVSRAKWNRAHREKEKAYSAKYREENAEKVKATVAKWCKENPERCAVMFSKRRALKYANTPLDQMLMSTEWLVVLAEAAGHCHYCDQVAKLTIDHVIPLSRGGKDSKDNIVAACLHCNTSKGNKTLEEWNKTRQKAVVVVAAIVSMAQEEARRDKN
jgi:5-methylcytosine-specific restriction endonuclease McrA